MSLRHLLQDRIVMIHLLDSFFLWDVGFQNFNNTTHNNRDVNQTAFFQITKQ